MKNNLRILRKQKGMTLQQLSDSLKNNNIQLSPTAISYYERGLRNLKPMKLQQLADFFAVPVQYLKGDSSYQPTISLLDKLRLKSKSWKSCTNNNLYFERNEKRLSQDDLARKIGVSREAISKYELGVRDPEWDIWRSLSKELNSETTYLQGINGRYYPYNAKIENKQDEKMRFNKLYGFIKSLDDKDLSIKTEQLFQKLEWAYAKDAFSLLYLLIKLYGSSYDIDHVKRSLESKNPNSVFELEMLIENILSMFINNDEKSLYKIVNIIEQYANAKQWATAVNNVISDLS
ncbi:helix-turn-helix transcriptional regulator [Limosilactobacillus antri]|uniref:helix-turn-helix transcriptional regulator n=1 Tax=Limosilactobacillus antri TaxID=227943 RepID=UPI001F55D2FD|nr:helix-turn-helix transcriptional regulator [Limosilactobacillus antri]